jgi:hypothetical protein
LPNNWSVDIALGYDPRERRAVTRCDKIARAIEDSFEFQAFSSDYIANILQQRERFSPQPGPLHLTRRQDLLEVELEQPDLSVYEG